MALLAGCSPLTLVNWASPNFAQTRHADLVFQEDTALALDVYEPESDSPGPTILFFYGGSWQRGGKDQYRFVASRLTRLGYRVVIPNYRLYPDVVFPAFIEDSAESYRWVADNIHRYGGQQDQIYLMGHSAGAHIAALLHYDDRHLARVDDGTLPDPAGFIGLSGPYDFLPLTSDALRSVFPEALRADSQPINFAQAAAGPALLLHGGSDSTVGPGNAKRLAARARESGNDVTVRYYDGRGHAGVLLALTRPLGALAPVVEDIDAFIRGTEQAAKTQ
jgi:acetyl esterase/lipase